MLVVVLVFIGTVFAQAADKVTFATPNAKYRKIDKDGSVVGEEYWKRAEQTLGVGNIIFSSGPVPFEKEDTYKGVGTKFNFADLETLTARAYYPGRERDIIKYIEGKNKGFEFVGTYMVLQLYKPVGGDNNQTMVGEQDDESLGWDQQRWDLMPTCDWKNVQIGEIISNGDPGEYEVQISYWLKFKTGKTRFVTRSEGGSLVTTEEDILKSFIIAYGECNINK